MRKETFIAIIIGISVGLLIAFGIWRANAALQGRSLISTEFIPTEAPLKPVVPTKELAINLVRPENLLVSNIETVTYSGATKPQVILVISTETKDVILRAPDSGLFSQDVALEGGLNQVLLSAFDNVKSEVKLKNMVVFSTEFTDSSDEGQDSVSDNLKDRLAGASSTPRAFMGTVTDKTDNSLQIKNFEGTIQIVAIAEDATFAQGLTAGKALKYTDIAIGDYIIAMGYEKTKGVLTTERVVVSKPFSEPTRKILYGKILSINKKVITIEDKNTIAWVLTLPTKWVGPDVKDLVVGQNLIAIGEPEADKPENINVRTLGLEPKIENTPTLSPTPTKKITPTVKPSATLTPTPRI